VAAIGNTGTSATEFYPATDPNVIAVAGTDPADRRYIGSITGSQAFVAAPGENILTVVGDSDYDHLTGTSFSAPFVSAAVWLAKRGSKQRLTNAQVRWLLAHSVEKPGQGRTMELGYGRLDMGQLVKQLPKVPSSDECTSFFGHTLPSAERMALR
jgi:subtilisin family serine protease